jgi:hypothetical protein
MFNPQIIKYKDKKSKYELSRVYRVLKILTHAIHFLGFFTNYLL